MQNRLDGISILSCFFFLCMPKNCCWRRWWIFETNNFFILFVLQQQTKDLCCWIFISLCLFNKLISGFKKERIERKRRNNNRCQIVFRELLQTNCSFHTAMSWLKKDADLEDILKMRQIIDKDMKSFSKTS